MTPKRKPLRAPLPKSSPGMTRGCPRSATTPRPQLGKGAKMDVAGLSTWQTVTLKAADAQIRLMDEGTLTTVDLKAFLHRRGHSQEAHRPHASGLQRDRHRHGGALGHDPQGDPGALSRPAVSRLQLRLLHPKGQRRIRGRPRDRSLSVSGRTGLCGRHVSGCVRRVHEVALTKNTVGINLRVSVVAFVDAPASCESQTVEELYQSNLL